MPRGSLVRMMASNLLPLEVFSHLSFLFFLCGKGGLNQSETNLNIFIAGNISIWMYIMCVILCIFSALKFPLLFKKKKLHSSFSLALSSCLLKTDFERSENTTMAAAILCPAACISHLVNKG